MCNGKQKCVTARFYPAIVSSFGESPNLEHRPRPASGETSGPVPKICILYMISYGEFYSSVSTTGMDLAISYGKSVANFTATGYGEVVTVRLFMDMTRGGCRSFPTTGCRQWTTTSRGVHLECVGDVSARVRDDGERGP